MKPPSAFKSFQRSSHAIFQARPSWLSYWRAWLGMLAVIAVSLVQRQLFEGVTSAVGIPSELSEIVMFIPAGLIVLGIVFHRYTRSYEIEDQRVLRTTVGFIARTKREYALSDKIQIDAGQSVAARLLNYGTVGFWTGDELSRMEWRNVADPDKLVTFIRRLNTESPLEGSANNHAAGQTRSAKTSSQKETDIPKSSASIARPPQGTVFAKHVIRVPNFPGTFARVPGGLKPAVESYQWIERGQPLLVMTLQTRNSFIHKESDTVEVTIPSPASGLVVHSTMSASNHTELWYSRTTLLPAAKDPPSENGAYVYGALKDALWAHRQYLFRDNKTMREMKKMTGSHRDFALKLENDQFILEALQEMCAQNCDIVDARPHFDPYFVEAWHRWEHLRPFLNGFVDDAAKVSQPG